MNLTDKVAIGVEIGKRPGKGNGDGDSDPDSDAYPADICGCSYLGAR
jgi:hypothetical protein